MKVSRPESPLPQLALILSSLSLAFSATLPAASSRETNLEISQLNSDRPINCVGGVPFSPFYLTLHGCLSAISQISTSQDPGEFHTGEPFDQWSLPMTKTWKYCKVTVEMAQPWETDSSSWLGINLAATQLNMQCASRYGFRYAGGSSSTGNRGEIKVKLEKVSNWGMERNMTSKGLNSLTST